MKFTSTIIALAALFSVSAASPTASTDVQPVRFNTFYDNGQQSLNNVACSNGDNGLTTKGFTNFGSLPSFPYVGAGFAVHNWNSPECGSCWQLTYEDTGVTIYATVIDTVYSGFDLSEAAVDALTNGNAEQFSFINVDSTEVDPSYCGL